MLLLLSGLLLAVAAYRQPRAARLDVSAPRLLLPRAGMTPPERFADRPGLFSWTDGAARLGLPNPGGAPELEIAMAGGPGRGSEVVLRAAGLRYRFELRPELRTYRVLLPPGAGERIDLAVESLTFEDRGRDLGVVVSDVRVGGAGPPPAWLLLWAAFATAGVFTLLHHIGVRLWLGAGAVLALQAALLAWQALDGWRYGLLGGLLPLAGLAGFGLPALERLWPPRPTPEAPAAPLARRDLAVLALLAALALCLRLPWLTAPDPVGDLTLSGRQLAGLAADGLAGAYRGPSDYMPLRLYYLLGFARLLPLLGADTSEPLGPAVLVLLKLPGLLADLATVGVLYAWSRRWRSRRGAALVAGLYALAPPVWINVAWWGQVDALLMLALLGVVTLLGRAEGRWAWVCWAAALLIKAQAVLLAPLLLVATLRRYGSRGVARGAALAGGLGLAAAAPLVLAGRGQGLLESYLGSVGRFPRITNRAYNLWFLVVGGRSESDTLPLLGPLSYRQAGLLLVGAATLLVCLALLRRNDGPARAGAAAVLALAFFALPTQIHERYLFLTLAFLALRMAEAPRLASLFLALVLSATLNVLGTLSGFSPELYEALGRLPALPYALSALNLLALAALALHLLLTTFGRQDAAAVSPPQRAQRAQRS